MNMLGIREPATYGYSTYEDLCTFIDSFCGCEHEFFQSNWEGAIIDKIQSAYKTFDGIVINAAAYTHTSLAIADALRAVSVPYAEVHISDVNSREDYRRFSYLSADAVCVVSGKGFEGYREAYLKLTDYIDSRKEKPDETR